MRFSIITVVYNDVKNIESTINSVLSQTEISKEFIVIDGNSEDGTYGIIDRYRSDIDCIIHEPDRGIYDAMNKGVSYCKGEWVIFMNSGDVFFDDQVLERINALMSLDSDIVYGHHQVVFQAPRPKRIVKAGACNRLIYGSQFCHQAALVKRERLLFDPFDLNHKLTADFKFFLRAYQAGLKFQRVEMNIATILADGVSDINQIKVISSWWKIVEELYGVNKFSKTSIYYALRLVRSFFTQILKSIIYWVIRKKS